MDERPALGGWIPSDNAHVIHCRNCGERFLGSPRAVMCAPCAYHDDDDSKQILGAAAVEHDQPRSLLWPYVFGAVFWALVALGLWLTIR